MLHQAPSGKLSVTFHLFFLDGNVIGAICIGYLSEKTSDILLQQYGHIGMLIGIVYLLGIGTIIAFVFKMKRTFLDYEPSLL